MKKFFLTFLALAWIPLATEAQTLTFTAQTTTGNGSVVPVLTWATTPTAEACVASGDAAWTGAKAAAGTQTLASITASRTYNLVCTWPGNDRATVTWNPPTTNTDGSSLMDLKGFKVYFSTNRDAVDLPTQDSPFVVNSPTTLRTVIGPLPAGTWHFAVKAFNNLDSEGPASNLASKIISATSSVTRTVGIVVNPVPSAPTNLTVE